MTKAIFIRLCWSKDYCWNTNIANPTFNTKIGEFSCKVSYQCNQQMIINASSKPDSRQPERGQAMAMPATMLPPVLGMLIPLMPPDAQEGPEAIMIARDEEWFNYQEQLKLLYTMASKGQSSTDATCTTSPSTQEIAWHSMTVLPKKQQNANTWSCRMEQRCGKDYNPNTIQETQQVEGAKAATVTMHCSSLDKPNPKSNPMEGWGRPIMHQLQQQQPGKPAGATLTAGSISNKWHQALAGQQHPELITAEHPGSKIFCKTKQNLAPWADYHLTITSHPWKTLSQATTTGRKQCPMNQHLIFGQNTEYISKNPRWWSTNLHIQVQCYQVPAYPTFYQHYDLQIQLEGPNQQAI